MEFLRPTKRQFPFDDVCAEIVLALEARNFETPGMRVELSTYGSGEQKLRYVRLIEGRDFRIYFCRVQRAMPGGRRNDIAGVTSVAIPKKKIDVYEDESGPRFWLYVGDDWDAHREAFLRGPGVLSRHYQRPRTYVTYRGTCDCDPSPLRHSHGGRRSPVLVADNDLGREYDPQGDEPTMLRTQDVLAELSAYLRDVVLATIVAHPEADVRIDPLADPAPTPFPEGVGPIFCFGDHVDARRIRRGHGIDPGELNPSDRYGMPANAGYRLMPLDVRDDGVVPPIAYEGFLWCGLGEVTTTVHTSRITGLEIGCVRTGPEEAAVPIPRRNLRIPGYSDGFHDDVVIRVKPKWADGVYVVDHAPYDRRRAEISAEIAATPPEDGVEPRKTYSRGEIEDFTRARARTIVPIAEYVERRGDFVDPVILICRELSLDEVEVVLYDERR